jgi:hypothetical protein
MAGIRVFTIHQTWEDWLGIGLGLLIGLTPWITGEADSNIVTYNAMLIGVLVLALGAFEISDLHRWEEGAEIACGVWLIASPFMFGYADAGALRYWHFGLGAIVVLVAVLELWQDWRLSDKELARHGYEAR